MGFNLEGKLECPLNGPTDLVDNLIMTANSTATSTSKPSPGLSPGSKAGIRVGVSVGVIGALVAGLLLLWRNSRKSSGPYDGAAPPHVSAYEPKPPSCPGTSDTNSAYRHSGFGPVEIEVMHGPRYELGN